MASSSSPRLEVVGPELDDDVLIVRRMLLDDGALVKILLNVVSDGSAGEPEEEGGAMDFFGREAV